MIHTPLPVWSVQYENLSALKPFTAGPVHPVAIASKEFSVVRNEAADFRAA